jgi:hypothetical protein
MKRFSKPAQQIARKMYLTRRFHAAKAASGFVCAVIQM